MQALGGLGEERRRQGGVAAERPLESGRCSYDGLPLEDGGTHVANRGVTTALVIKHFDVVEQRHLGVAAAGESIGQFAFS